MTTLSSYIHTDLTNAPKRIVQSSTRMNMSICGIIGGYDYRVTDSEVWTSVSSPDARVFNNISWIEIRSTQPTILAIVTSTDEITAGLAPTE